MQELEDARCETAEAEDRAAAAQAAATALQTRLQVLSTVPDASWARAEPMLPVGVSLRR